MKCVTEVLAYRAGDTEALRRLREAASQSSGNSTCPLLLADLLEGEERLEYLRSLEMVPHEYRRYFDLLALEAELRRDGTISSWEVEPSVLSTPPAELMLFNRTHFAQTTALEIEMLELLDGLAEEDSMFYRTRAILRTQVATFDTLKVLSPTWGGSVSKSLAPRRLECGPPSPESDWR
jgi:hypothetical protein